MAVTNKVYYDRLNKWADALVSRKYKQIGNALRDEDNGRCCLGVSCDVSGLGEWRGVKFKGRYADVPPRAVAKYFGFNEIAGGDVVKTVSTDLWVEHTHLAGLNDSGDYTFDKIAKIIRKYAEIKYGNPKKAKKSKG